MCRRTKGLQANGAPLDDWQRGAGRRGLSAEELAYRLTELALRHGGILGRAVRPDLKVVDVPALAIPGAARVGSKAPARLCVRSQTLRGEPDHDLPPLSVGEVVIGLKAKAGLIVEGMDR